MGDLSLGDTGLTLPIDAGQGRLDSGLPSGGTTATQGGEGTGLAGPTGADGPLVDADGEQVVPPRPITTEDMKDLAEVEAELDQRWPETKIDPTLERVQLLMDLLGNPERAFPVIHVAGTNGKTSTVRMIESLMRAFHRRTGRTTSPHLQIVTERIAVDGEPIHPRDYVATWREIQPYVEMVDAKSQANGGPKMSKFEVLVAMAYSSFADAPVDVAVVETGMGGRWDATNVVNADVAVITPIGLDHMDYLGDTIEEIAAEKAGIIKSRWDADDLLTPPDNVTVIAEQDPDAMRVVLAEAVDKDSAVARAGSEFGVADAQIAVGGQQITLRGLGGMYEDIFLPLSGEHQARNAAVALAAVEAFFGAGSGRQLDIDTVREGFAKVTSPGRLERVRSAPSVFIDASHNPHGAKALAAAVARDFSFRRLVGVVGVLGDKDARGILAALEPVLDEVVITRTQSPRALDEETLAEYARDAFGEERVHVTTNLPGAVELAIELAEDDGDEGMVSGAGVLITGSVVTAGEARTLFGKQPC
ncbi:bifunctional tetrahydrofolate synthase/dihydrofolate synthase [Corynebacterium auriscanis]|uniref:bifunctional tetrahydrofolate synthase/dihydrofolate synthase n=1 Tax=Corynebacterium auriscanis TaxID=99807 RepID=UPI002246301E|nr:folylpolyglutamate synthase/dihydrofolate synthase family protein [Corynebacterium auriscanis]MCX2163350.1 bifunctional folylpolyglutamate synthase/dihydrofolate synthase [Corynebacterium auriscanis]